MAGRMKTGLEASEHSLRRSGRRPHGGSVLDLHIILTLHNPMTSSGCATCKESLPTHGDQRHLLLGATAATRSSACAPWQEKCMERSSSSSGRDGLDQLAVEGGTRAHTTDQRMRRRAGLLGVWPIFALWPWIKTRETKPNQMALSREEQSLFLCIRGAVAKNEP